MDAHALLSSQGWRGTGHSLHKTDDAIGLAKPLLLNRKDNTKGLGQKQHFTSDQWWMNAFDEQLRGLDTSKKGTVVQTISTGKLNGIEKGMGRYSVYATFVRGGFLEGTMLTPKEKASSTSDSDSDDDANKTTKSEKPEAPKETKEEKRVRREARRKRKAERAQARTARQERRLKKANKSSRKTCDAKEEKRLRRARKEEKRKQSKQEKEQ
ncbi:hypothetical protein G7046_g3237 [Stylonectria norvegica]|nr:hypothetical protein G7046_g3237 [Stylonectria norvegica]